jgi:UDP-galactopyranose mutase
MKYDFIVVGAGLAGSTSARVLAEAGKRVLVVEKNDHPAGLCHDYTNEWGITVQTGGPHIFHTNKRHVWRFVRRFASFRPYRHRVLSRVRDSYVPFPINRDTVCRLFGVRLTRRGAREFLREQVRKSSYREPPADFRDAVVSQVGEILYETLYENYTRKQWGKDPRELDAALAQRIPVRDNRDDRYFTDVFQGVPRGGYTRLVGRMLAHDNIACRWGENYFAVRDRLPRVPIVYTGKLDEYFAFRHGALEYRSLAFEYKTFDYPRHQPAGVVNYPNDHEWTRTTEFKYFLGERSPKTTVGYEYPRGQGLPCYMVPTEDNLERRDRYLMEALDLEAAGACCFVGRLAEYRYYNMDEAIDQALRKTARLLNGPAARD